LSGKESFFEDLLKFFGTNFLDESDRVLEVLRLKLDSSLLQLLTSESSGLAVIREIRERTDFDSRKLTLPRKEERRSR
jgi:hypothetical protein